MNTKRMPNQQKKLNVNSRKRIGDQWREDQGVQGRKYILVLVKEEIAEKRKWRESESRRIKDE